MTRNLFYKDYEKNESEACVRAEQVGKTKLEKPIITPEKYSFLPRFWRGRLQPPAARPTCRPRRWGRSC